MKRIKLTQGKFTLVDDDDYPFLNKFKWQLHKGKSDRAFYARGGVRIKGRVRSLRMHYCIIGRPLYGKMVDHIDGNGLNNQRSNLRIVDSRANNSNRHSQRTGLSHD